MCNSYRAHQRDILADATLTPQVTGSNSRTEGGGISIHRTQNLQACQTHNFLNVGPIAAEIFKLLSIPLFSAENIVSPPKFKVPILVGLKMCRIFSNMATTSAYIASTISGKATLRLDSIILWFGNDLEAQIPKEKFRLYRPGVVDRHQCSI